MISTALSPRKPMPIVRLAVFPFDWRTCTVAVVPVVGTAEDGRFSTFSASDVVTATEAIIPGLTEATLPSNATVTL